MSRLELISLGLSFVEASIVFSAFGLVYGVTVVTLMKVNVIRDHLPPPWYKALVVVGAAAFGMGVGILLTSAYVA